MTANAQLLDEAASRSYVQTWGEPDAFAKVERFADMLVAENQRQNLISKASMETLWQRHLADAAQLLEHVPRETYENRVPGKWLDLGSGPGLPGLVIAITKPRIPVVLVESRARRVEFLDRCVDELSITNCTVIGTRLERVEPFKAWFISARAFAPLDKLLKLSAPFSTKQTRYLLPKGRSAAQELAEQKPAVRRMFHVEQSLTDPEAGIIVSK